MGAPIKAAKEAVLRAVDASDEPLSTEALIDATTGKGLSKHAVALAIYELFMDGKLDFDEGFKRRK